MATPVWSTTAGKIASIDEQSAFSLQLEANTSDSTAITYSLIAGSLPFGMQVTSDGLLTGTPAEVAKRTLYIGRKRCRCTNIHNIGGAT